jgi:hypothetical protein
MQSIAECHLGSSLFLNGSSQIQTYFGSPKSLMTLLNLVCWSIGVTAELLSVSQVPVQIDARSSDILTFYHAILSLLAKGISPQQKL